MALPETLRLHLLHLKQWATAHKGEILWAAFFAVLVAVPVGWMLSPPEPKPYKVYVVTTRYSADYDNHEENRKLFDAMNLESKRRPLHIRDVPVELGFEELDNKRGNNAQEMAVTQARNLANGPDTLLIIGQQSSQIVETVLPIYFQSQPPVPFLATVATDDDLLKQCPSKCRGDEGSAPLLQLPPTNQSQAEAAVRFAIQRGRKRFFVKKEDQSSNQAYVDDLAEGYRGAIERYRNMTDTDYISEGGDLTHANLTDGDCILYAGSFMGAANLLQHLSATRAMVILSDSSVRAKIFARELYGTPARFTYWRDAADYNTHQNSYAWDAFAIATELIEDLDRRTGRWYWLKAKFHIETVRDARKNLVDIMRENSVLRVSYDGWPYLSEHPAVYVFRHEKRVGAMFHVWETKPRSDRHDAPLEMVDIDGWHPPSEMTKPR